MAKQKSDKDGLHCTPKTSIPLQKLRQYCRQNLCRGIFYPINDAKQCGYKKVPYQTFIRKY